MGRNGYIVPVDLDTQLKKSVGSGSCNWILLNYLGQRSELKLDKYAIMRRYGIDARDLRILDLHITCPSTILGRDKAILLILEHIKAIITANEVLVRDPWDEYVIPVVQELQRQLSPRNLALKVQAEEESNELFVEAIHEEEESPFEFRTLEVLLDSICNFFAARTTELETAAYPSLDALTSKISSRNLDRIRKLKSAMTRLTVRAQKVKDELEKFLEDDDGMADLYLSRKLAPVASPVSSLRRAQLPSSPTLGSKISKASRMSVITVHGDDNDVEELEMLLEAYFSHVEGTLNKLTTLREYIDDTEDYIHIQLDSHRNQLIQLELFLNAGTVCLSIFSLVTGIFGVNLPYEWNQNHGYIFKWVLIVTGFSTTMLFLFIIAYARHKGLVGS